MGFGYVFLGYLTAFVLALTVKAMGFGGLAILVGYVLMFYGLFTLTLYQRAFAWAKWMLPPLMVTAAFDLLTDLGELFLWDLSFLSAGLREGVAWGTFVLLMLFHFALLYGIRAIGTDVGLKSIAMKATRNNIFVGIYAVLYVVARSLPALSQQAEAYFSVPLTLVQIVYLACNLLLLANCTKDICPAGEEDLPPKRSRFEVINRIGDAYERNQQKAINRTLEEAEERMRRRQAGRNKKNIQHYKKKKKK